MPTFRLVAAFRQFYLFDDEACPPYPETITDADLERRLKAVANLIAVYAESDAEVEVDVECVERTPNVDESPWAHIVEGPLSLPSGRVVLASPSSYLPECPRFPVSPGAYRVRVSVSGGDGGERERYLISLWPSQARPVAVIKSAGQHAA